MTTSVTAKRLKDDIIIIAVHNSLKRSPLDLYRSRRSIETLFRSLKTNQFNIESTSIAAPLKLRNLIRLLAKVGIILVSLPGITLCRAFRRRSSPYAKASLGKETTGDR